jgi:hypothetical protein
MHFCITFQFKSIYLEWAFAFRSHDNISVCISCLSHSSYKSTFCDPGSVLVNNVSCWLKIKKLLATKCFSILSLVAGYK